MGRGSKIFLLSAFLSACVFGLVAFVIISAVMDGMTTTLIIINTDDSGKEISYVLVDRENVSAITKDVKADRKIILKITDVQRICSECDVEYKDVSNSQNAVYIANKVIDRLKKEDGEELLHDLIAGLDTDLTGDDLTKWKKSIEK